MKKSLLHRLIHCRRGAVVTMLSLGLVPALGISYGALEYTERNTIMTRLHQSQIQALYAVCKEGPQDVTIDGERQGKAWMEVNTSEHVFRRKHTNFSHDIKIDNEYVTISSLADGTSLSSKYIAQVMGIEQKSWAQFYYRPIEIAYAMDASPSYKALQNTVEKAMKASLDEVFLGKDEADDVWASINFVSTWVNIGTKYKDKLLNPDSVLPYYDFDEVTSTCNAATKKTATQYKEALEEMLASWHPQYRYDLSADGAPGMDIGTLCVHRPPLAGYLGKPTETQIEEYIENIFLPPDGSKDNPGFDMVQGIPFPVAGSAVGAKKNGTYLFAFTPAMFFNGTSNSLNVNAVGYEGVTLDQVSLLNMNPDTTANFNYADIVRCKADPAIYNNWTKWGIATNGIFGKLALAKRYPLSMVSIPNGCPRVGMVIGSNNKKDILDTIENWGTSTGTSHDEGFAWALRALEPNYEPIWEIPDYPAPYEKDGGDREKRLVFLTDNDVAGAGYQNASWGKVDMISRMCVAAEERGIDVYMVSTAKLTKADAKNIFNNCAPEERQIIGTNVNQLAELMAEASKRKFRVRIVSKP